MSDITEIRHRMKAYREGLSEEEILKLSKEIENRLYEIIHSSNRKEILCFYPMEVEVNLLPLYERLLKERFLLYFPKTYQEEIIFYKVDNMRDFKLGAFRIMEPYGIGEKNRYQGNAAVCIAPGLAFSKDGHRVGYGGGYYDRFLKNKNILKVGVCFDSQITNLRPQLHDVDMDLVITDQNIYKK